MSNKYAISLKTMQDIARVPREVMGIPSEAKIPFSATVPQMRTALSLKYDQGKQQQYDEFWDEYQTNGDRTDYQYAFAGAGWTDDTFKPKYPITPKGSMKNAFADSLIAEIPDNMLNTSGATNFDYAFASMKNIKQITMVDCSNAKSLTYTFYASTALETLGIKVVESCTYTSPFTSCNALVNLNVVGTIGNDIGFPKSTKLAIGSIIKIINALSSTATGKTLTLSKVAVDKAWETSEGANDGSTTTGWLSLVGTKNNWTISLA